MSYSETGDVFWSEGLHFSCTSCGHCCRHEPGYVFLSKNDLSQMASAMKMSKKRFAEKYCRTVDLGIAKRLSLLEKDNNDCIFWENGCKVYEARPLQCRTYPFWPAIMASRSDWDAEGRECPGINQGRLHTKEEISDALRLRERETLITPD